MIIPDTVPHALNHPAGFCIFCIRSRRSLTFRYFTGNYLTVLIAGIPGNTTNYEHALSRCRIRCETSLHPENLSSYDKLLLPGGGDIHPSRFGQEDRGSAAADKALDEAQFSLLHAFLQAGKPVLGICRGMQIINVYLGGDLIQDLPTAPLHRWSGQDQAHQAQTEPGSLLSAFCPPLCQVNSAHHQGCGRIGTGLTVTQWSPDGVPEAVEHENGRILGVQWHPERTHLLSHLPDMIDGGRIIRYFAESL